MRSQKKVVSDSELVRVLCNVALQSMFRRPRQAFWPFCKAAELPQAQSFNERGCELVKVDPTEIRSSSRPRQSGVGRTTGDDMNAHRVVHSFWRRASHCNFTCDACDAQPPVPVPVPVVPLAIPVQAALLSGVKYTCCPPVGEVATLSMTIPLEPPADARAAKGFALGPVGGVATL